MMSLSLPDRTTPHEILILGLHAGAGGLALVALLLALARRSDESWRMPIPRLAHCLAFEHWALAGWKAPASRSERASLSVLLASAISQVAWIMMTTMAVVPVVLPMAVAAVLTVPVEAALLVTMLMSAMPTRSEKTANGMPKASPEAANGMLKASPEAVRMLVRMLMVVLMVVLEPARPLPIIVSMACAREIHGTIRKCIEPLTSCYKGLQLLLASTIPMGSHRAAEGHQQRLRERHRTRGCKKVVCFGRGENSNSCLGP